MYDIVEAVIFNLLILLLSLILILPLSLIIFLIWIRMRTDEWRRPRVGVEDLRSC
jgi:hypothetical protein